MARRVFQRILVVGVALALWTLARPAMAAPAPFCDDRGATALAQPPTLEASDVGVQQARVPASCPGEEVAFGAVVTRGSADSAPPLVTADPVLPTSATALVAAPGEDLGARPRDDSPADGVRYRIERPPRV